MTTVQKLADTPLAELREQAAAGNPVLAAVLRRVFEPKDRDKLTVSAFGSSL